MRLPEPDRRRRGGVLLLALIPTLLVSMLALAFFELTRIGLSRRQAALDTKRVLYLCEAGLHEAMAGLYIGQTGEVGQADDPVFFGEGLFWVEVSHPAADLVKLDSFAGSRGATAHLSWIVERIQFNYAAYGFFSGEKLKLKPGSFVDGYDSSLGSYQSQVDSGLTLEAGRMASNHSIEIEGKSGEPTVLHGSANPGLGSEVELQGEATMTGGTQSLDEFALPPAFEVPDPPWQPDVVVSSPIPTLLPAGDRRYDEIEVKQGRELILRGPSTIVVKDLDVKKDARITVDTTDGPVVLHVTHHGKFDRGAALVSTADAPRGVTLVIGEGGVDGSGAKLEVDEGGLVQALVLAPHDKVELGEGAELFGAIVAGELHLDESVRLHFDRALGLQEHQYPRHVSWRVVDLGVGPIDPFASAGVAAPALRSPAQAHRDVWLKIKYRTGAGQPKLEYEGWWSSFDWGSVYELAPCYRVYEDDGGAELLHVHP